MGKFLVCLIGFLFTGCGIKIEAQSPKEWASARQEQRHQEQIAYNKERMNRCTDYCKPYAVFGFVSNGGCICTENVAPSCPAPKDDDLIPFIQGR